jgi:phenylpropionate dioxygenase-like ring-hydroxylating dioxygenase large terminal subunit
MAPLERRLLENFWHLVAHRCELAEPGAWLRLDWPLGDLALFNDEGEIIAFDNLCPHRGARFFVGDSGAGRMTCAYHGWSYRGGCLRVAQPGQFDETDLAGVNIRRYKTVWCGDFLFVGLSPQQSLDDQLGPIRVALADAGARIAARADFNAFAFQSNWRVAVENALESYHVNAIHGQTLAPLALIDEEVSYAERNILYTARISDPRTARALEAARRFFDGAGGHKGYWSLYVFPFAMFSSTFGYSYALQTYFPTQEVKRSDFCSRMFTARMKPGAEAALESFFASSIEVNRRIFEEDHAICARVSPAYDMAAPKRIFARSESRVRFLHETLSALD